MPGHYSAKRKVRRAARAVGSIFGATARGAARAGMRYAVPGLKPRFKGFMKKK